MIKIIIKYAALASFLLSYLFLIWNYSKFGQDSNFTQLFNIAWIFGIASVILNAVYVIIMNMKDDYLWWIGFVGLIWIVPFFIEFESLYGIPSLIIYFILILFIHRKIL